MSKRHGITVERKAVKILEAAGFEVVRSAGSRGAVDLVAWDHHRIRLIQVKYGSATMTAAQKEALALLAHPAGSTIELWQFDKYGRAPRIEVLA